MTAAPRGYLRVRVVPRAARTTLTRDAGGVLRVHLSAAPVDGAANRALVELLATHLRVPKRAIEVSRGTHGRDKVLCIHGTSPDDLAARLERALGSDVDKAKGRG